MTLEEEKKLVAEWMGWRVNQYHSLGLQHFVRVTNNPESAVYIDAWNPQSYRNCWDEIWENMNDDIKEVYLDNLTNILPVQINGIVSWLEIHTAKPEKCWKALIETLTKNGV